MEHLLHQFIYMFSNCQEEQKNGKGAKFQPNVIMQGHSPSDYVLNIVSNVRPNDLEQALLVSLSCMFVVLLKLKLILSNVQKRIIHALGNIAQYHCKDHGVGK